MLTSNVSLQAGQCIRDCTFNEIGHKADTLSQIIKSVVDLGCQPSSFLRLLKCEKHGFIATCRVFCPFCNTRLLQGCSLLNCPGCCSSRLKSSSETRLCTHKRKTASNSGLITESMISIIGNMVQFGLIDQCIDVTRNQIAMKIRLCTTTDQLCITCGINNMQTLIALGETELARLLVSYYQEIKTPKECRAFLMNGIADFNSSSIEFQFFFASKEDICIDDQYLVTEYMSVLRDTSCCTVSTEESTCSQGASDDIVAEAANDAVGYHPLNDPTAEDIEMMNQELESLRRRSDAAAIGYSLLA